MSTPNRSFKNYNSPYSRPVQQEQYPSQVEDFIKFNTPISNRKQWPQQHRGRGSFRYSSTPIKETCNEKTEDDEEKARGSGESNKKIPYFYQNHAHPQQQQQRYSQNFSAQKRGGGGNYRGRWNNSRHGRPSFQNFQQQRNNEGAAEGDTFSLYFHPSMLEDPWKELMDRHNALHRSMESNQSSKVAEDEESSSSAPSEANSYFDDSDDDAEEKDEKVKATKNSESGSE